MVGPSVSIFPADTAVMSAIAFAWQNAEPSGARTRASPSCRIPAFPPDPFPPLTLLPIWIPTGARRVRAPLGRLLMIDVRRFDSLGGADHGWLKAHHHFSFANYYEPSRMGWGRLRVWNDDEIAAKSGFPPHPHADMEIITYVRTGTITHEDSMGNRGRTAAGDVQVMSAGTGVRHSEFNLEDET